MKQKYFYSHIVTTEDISLAIADTDMPNDKRVKLINLAEENLHHSILENMLDELSNEEDKKEFLLHLTSQDHEKVWRLLKNKVKNAEDIILETSKKLKKEMHEDIRNSSR